MNFKKTSRRDDPKNTFLVKLMFSMALILLFLPITSAWEFDNSYDYDEITKTATLENIWGLGKDIGIARLDTPQIYQVKVGYSKVMQFTINPYTDYENLLGELELKDLKDNGKIIQRQIDIKYWGTKDYVINDYVCDEALMIKGDYEKACVISGNHIEQRNEWVDWDKNAYENKEVIVALFTTVGVDETVDIIPTLAGEKINEWAVFTSGDVTTIDGAYTVVKYLNNGSFNITDKGFDVEVLVVAGGGGGTVTGAGAGGLIYNASYPVAIGNYVILVGDGGEGVTAGAGVHGKKGINSSFDTLHALGGGGGQATGQDNGQAGGSGGGSNIGDGSPSPGGLGLVGQGNNGGTGTTWDVPRPSGAGGGAGAVGGTGTGSTSGSGGVGLAYTILNGSSIYYAGGGGSVNWEDSGTHGTGGLGGGGDGIFAGGEDGEDGLGGGGGGVAYDGAGSDGGSGVVIIRYLTADASISPTVTVNAPIDNLNSTTPLITFNVDVTDSVGVTNVSLIINDVITQTNSSGFNGTYIFTETLSDGTYDWNITAYNILDVSKTSDTRSLNINTTPFIEFLTPPTLINYANITQEYIPMKVDVSTSFFKNITYLLLNTNGTNYIQFYENQTFDINFTNIPDAHYHYNVTVCTTTNQCNSTETRHINHDATPPALTTALNLTDLVTFSLPVNSTWNYTATDPAIDKCYFNTSDHATSIITCNASIDSTWATEGNKTITYCANDTFGNEDCLINYIFVYYLQETQTDSPDPVAESFNAVFDFIVNLTSIPTTTATLVLNNTVYAPTITTAGTNGYHFEVTIEIPDGWGNTTGIIQDWFWNYTIDGVTTNKLTTTDNITVYELSIDDCSVFGELIFNFTVLDEETLVFANESETINVEADLILTSKTNANQEVTYSNIWSADNNPQICVPSGVINNSQYWINLTVGFSITDHVWEFFYIDMGTLNSTKIYESFNGQTTYNINLMDLLTTDSTSFLFNYFDIDGLAVDGSIVHVMRKYIGEGIFREVERAKQDQNGDTIVHLVEEDVIYFFMITKDGVLLHTSSEYTALCQTTPCTIQIEASGGSATFPTDWDLIDNGAYTITSSASTRDILLTYQSNESTSMGFAVYKYNSDGSYTVIDTGNDTGTSGTINLNVPQGAGNVSFFATVTQDDDFINSEWVDFEESASDRFGVTLALFLGALIILSLGLFAVSEGVGTIIYVVLGIVISGALGLVTTSLSTGVNIVVYLVLAGGILLWKLTEGRK